MNKKVLMTVGAHADDIEYCFGATALKYHEKFKYEIVYVEATNNMSGGWAKIIDGKIKTFDYPWYTMMPQRKLEANQSARECFHTEALHLDFPQRHYKNRDLETIELRYGAPCPDCVPPNTPSILTAHEDPASIERVVNLILDKDPEVILTHPPMDYTDEHTGTCMLVRKAFTKAQSKGYDGSLLFARAGTYTLKYGNYFNTWDSFIDTTGFMQKKRHALGIHACQVACAENLDLSDYLEGKVCGCETAEVFIVCEFAKKRTGELTKEFVNNHQYCVEHWKEMFFNRDLQKMYNEELLVKWEERARQNA